MHDRSENLEIVMKKFTTVNPSMTDGNLIMLDYLHNSEHHYRIPVPQEDIFLR